MAGRYRKLLIFWGLLFALAAAVVFVNLAVRPQSAGGVFLPGIETERPDAGPEEGEEAPGSAQTWTLILAVITAVASGGGFIVTTIFTLRNDRRESAIYQLQIENLKKEIEHKELEIARMRREQGAPVPGQKNKLWPKR